MVWAWNLVCGRFINFRNGKKFLTLLTFGCHSYETWLPDISEIAPLLTLMAGSVPSLSFLLLCRKRFSSKILLLVKGRTRAHDKRILWMNCFDAAKYSWVEYCIMLDMKLQNVVVKNLLQHNFVEPEHCRVNLKNNNFRCYSSLYIHSAWKTEARRLIKHIVRICIYLQTWYNRGLFKEFCVYSFWPIQLVVFRNIACIVQTKWSTFEATNCKSRIVDKRHVIAEAALLFMTGVTQK